jgi:hypothetical protein
MYHSVEIGCVFSVDSIGFIYRRHGTFGEKVCYMLDGTVDTFLAVGGIASDSDSAGGWIIHHICIAV